MQKLGEAKCEYDKINDFRLDVSTKCLSCDNRYFKKKNCSACASNVWSPTKFIISDNAKELGGGADGHLSPWPWVQERLRRPAAGFTFPLPQQGR